MSFGIIDATLEGRQRAFFPHFSANRVPMDPEKNRRWRAYLNNLTDTRDRKLIKKWCSEDALFYICSAAYIFDADSAEPKPVPFILYPFQIEILTVLHSLLYEERRPGRVKKPRRLGLTYLCLWLFEHCWHFKNHRHLLVGSHREDEVDGPLAVAKGSRYAVETSRLLPKIDFGHVHMPQWLLPETYTPRTEPYRTRLKIVNPETQSIIWGTSASAASGHGERGFAVFWDEAAMTENLYDIIGGLSKFAPCKLWVSTINDLGHPFSTILREAPGIRQIEPQWWHHPEYAEGMTIDVETGERTSPWLQKELSEIGFDPILANRHYHADESKQVGGYYHAKVFETMLGSQRQGGLYGKPGTVMDPFHRGEFDVIDRPDGPAVSRWIEQPNGRWRLWTQIGLNGRVDRGERYVMGADIAAGTGKSDSTLGIAGHRRGEVVADFADNKTDAKQLARLACAVGKWFEGDDARPAKIIFESNGPFGGQFGQHLTKWGYPCLYKRPDGSLGWAKGSNRETEDAFAQHQLGITEGWFKERCMAVVDQMRQYQKPASGKGAPIHSRAKHAEDPEQKGENHGDSVINRVCICVILRNPIESEIPEVAAPPRSYAAMKARITNDRYKRALA